MMKLERFLRGVWIFFGGDCFNLDGSLGLGVNLWKTRVYELKEKDAG